MSLSLRKFVIREERNSIKERTYNCKLALFILQVSIALNHFSLFHIGCSHLCCLFTNSSTNSVDPEQFTSTNPSGLGILQRMIHITDLFILSWYTSLICIIMTHNKPHFSVVTQIQHMSSVTEKWAWGFLRLSRWVFYLWHEYDNSINVETVCSKRSSTTNDCILLYNAKAK